MKKLLALFIVVLGLALAACGSTGPTNAGVNSSNNNVIASAKSQLTSIPTAIVLPQSDSNELVRTDNQGAVAIMVEPLNLDSPGDALTFEVSMNTHSVNLSMDLSTLALLSTDNGNSVQAVSWDGGTEGGHHVSGNLTFPATNNGKSILDGAEELTLIIKDVDALERAFELLLHGNYLNKINNFKRYSDRWIHFRFD
jgi:hypothetical protein